MGIKIELPYETLDSIVLVTLKAQLKDCQFVLKNSSHAQDIQDYTKYCNAMKVLIKYYGG
jgi:hypothetical protein